MAQRGSFRGKRHSPYGNKGWKTKQENSGGMAHDRSPLLNRDMSMRDSRNHDNSYHEERHVDDRPARPEMKEKKFGTRGRLYVGNLPWGMTEDELRQLFSQYGETEQIYVEKEKNFAFVRMAYRMDGLKAIAALNGTELKGREMRVRFSASNCSVKVQNLHHTVSNELLAEAFSQFGEVEFAAVMTDDRGKSLGYGVVDFAKKSQAQISIEKCGIGCFILTRSPVPVQVTEFNRESEGLPDKQIQHGESFSFERDCAPRMAPMGSPEFNFAIRWKNLYEAENKVREEVEAQLKEQRRLLENETSQFHYHENTAMLRQQLLEHQREQMRLEERLREQEQHLKGAGGHPPLPLPGMPPPPPMLPGLPVMPIGIPQPLLTAINDHPGSEGEGSQNQFSHFLNPQFPK